MSGKLLFHSFHNPTLAFTLVCCLREQRQAMLMAFLSHRTFHAQGERHSLIVSHAKQIRQVAFQSISALHTLISTSYADLSYCLRCQTLRSYSLSLYFYKFHLCCTFTWSIRPGDACNAQHLKVQTLIYILLAYARRKRLQACHGF